MASTPSSFHFLDLEIHKSPEAYRKRSRGQFMTGVKVVKSDADKSSSVVFTQQHIHRSSAGLVLDHLHFPVNVFVKIIFYHLQSIAHGLEYKFDKREIFDMGGGDSVTVSVACQHYNHYSLGYNCCYFTFTTAVCCAA